MKHLKKFNEDIRIEQMMPPNSDKVKSMYISQRDMDDWDANQLTIETESGKKYFIDVKNIRDLDFSDNENE